MKNTASVVKRPHTLRQHGATPFAKTGMAIGISAAVFSPTGVGAAEELEMKPVTVVERVIDHNPYAEPDAPYKARKSGDDRRAKPLAETSATISVLTQQQIQDTGRSDLADILRGQPGITLGTGENGNAFGDRYIIRGQEARSDVFVDGLRDPGMTIRESFAVEQVEITKGPSATFAGRGATGGAVNAITKQATTAADFTKLSAGVGTDNFRRLTADSNFVLTDTAAFRINLLESAQDVPDRDPASRSRKGAALSFNAKPNDKLDMTADIYHLSANDRPDLGDYLNANSTVSKLPVYTQSGDFLKSSVDAYTLRVKYEVSDDTRITNRLRYGKTSNGYIATGARPGTNANTLRLSTHQGWQEVDYLANQLNIHLDREIAGMKHKIIVSGEYSDQTVLNGAYAFAGTTTLDNVAYGNLGALSRNYSTSATDKSDWNTKTVSLSVMDAVDVTDRWSLEGGVRLDKFKFSNRTLIGTTPVTYKLDDTLVNWHLGSSYKFRPDFLAYASYATGADFNGGESDVTNCAYGGICIPSFVLTGTTAPDIARRLAAFASSKPEKTQNIELGGKWNVNDGKLLLTAALFRMTKSDLFESGTISGVTDVTRYTTNGNINTAKFRIEGVELGLAGNLTDKLSAQGGIAVMNSKFLASANPALIGAGLANFPETTASLLLNYRLTPKLSFGGTWTYVDKKQAGSPESPGNGRFLPGYTTLDLFSMYRINKQLSTRLAIQNVENKDYYLATYTSGSFSYKGDARLARLTLNYDF